MEFERFVLENGLRVIVHQDYSTPIAAVNLVYDVGARDENPQQTGFAHLFEHLMFGGSVNIPDYDKPLQDVGGENNAFTNNDITNYYLSLPADNLETAFWLESDRMNELAFSPKSLEVQRNVVIEEFKQRYLNQPYGDVWLKFRPLIYKKHPYRWPTIGKEISHIENAGMNDVKEFFYKHYRPNNAVLVVAGPVDVDQVKALSEKWFAPIPNGEYFTRSLPVEPIQEEARRIELEGNVPTDAIYKAYHMCERKHSDYYTLDFISDILSRGKSSRLYQRLVKEQKLFSQIDAYITGDFDPGMFVITGKLKNGISVQQAEQGIQEEIGCLQNEEIGEKEYQKIINKVESTLEFAEMNVLDKAMDLAYFELLGGADMINEEMRNYKAVTPTTILDKSNQILQETNSSTLYYKSIQN